MKVHIALVGGQPAPIYNGIVATKPDKVVYIYSDSKISIATLDALRKEVNISEDRFPPLDSVDPSAIRSCARLLAKKYQNDEITVNISSGLKSWSHLFAEELSGLPNVHMIYMDQNNVLWDYRDDTFRDDYTFDMDTLFRLYRNPLENYHSFSSYTKEDGLAAREIAKMRTYNFSQFNKLVTVLSKANDKILHNNNKGSFSIDGGIAYVDWDKTGWVRLVLTHNKKGPKETTIQSPHAVGLTFNSGWFEYEVARMLSRWNSAQEIRLNCIFPPRTNPKNGRKFPKNEIDIIVNTGRKLLFVECKTNINSSNDIDKFRTAVKNYGGTASKALFVTENKMTDLQKEKCRESNILTFSLSEAGANKEEELFAMLNEQLLTINA